MTKNTNQHKLLAVILDVAMIVVIVALFYLMFVKYSAHITLVGWTAHFKSRVMSMVQVLSAFFVLILGLFLIVLRRLREAIVELKARARTEAELSKYRDSLEVKVRDSGEELRTKELLLENVINSTPDFIFVKDNNLRTILCNEAYARAVGKKPKDMLGHTDIENGWDPELVLGNPAKKIRGFQNDDMNALSGKVVHNHYDPANVGGVIRIFDTLKLPLYDNNKKIIGVLGVARDITEQDKSEAELKKYREHLEELVRERTGAVIASQSSYHAVFDSANDAIIIRDIKNYKVTDANNKACEMFCYSKEEFLGFGLEIFITDSDRFTFEKLRQIYEDAASGVPRLFEWLTKDRLGREFWVEVNTKRAVIGGKYQILSIVRDITERKEQESVKDNFISAVSHELRTPLGAIKESITMSLEKLSGSADTEKKELMDIAKKNVDRLSKFIDDVLDFQKLRSGKMMFEMKENDINKTVEEAQRMMLSLAGKKSLKFTLNLSGKLPKIIFDKDRITEVLTNIVSNAIKFTVKGGIVITTAQEGDHITVSVRDTGQGIRREDMPKLFTKFGQMSKAPNGTKGTGLGLVICKDIIEKHRGRIWVESEPGKETVVFFTLPVISGKG